MKPSFKLLKRTCQLILVLALLLSLTLLFKTPRNDLDWQTQYRVLPTVELQNDTISIQNLRDFRYNKDQSIAEVRYKNQNFTLSEFKNAWYGISHFGSNGLAHVLLSFEFSGDKFLVVSIEARMQNKHVKGYDPLKGLLRTYTKTIVLATEQDVIGLRTHIRGEPLFLYKLDVPELYTKPLLLNFLREAQVLTQSPVFYNSLIDNCMTGLLAQSDQFRSFWQWLDMRILLPGNSDKIAYELNYIDTSQPFNQTRARAKVDPSLTHIEDPEFSAKIRSF